MKKFTIKGVLDNFRTSVAQPQRVDQDIQETLRAEHFQVKRTFRHGFPFQPTAMAFDPVQKLLAIGSKCGSLRMYWIASVILHAATECYKRNQGTTLFLNSSNINSLGQPGVDVHIRHDMDGPPGSSAVLHLQFLVNEGALVAATADDTLHLWNFRQNLPQVVQSLKFQREKITCMHLPLTSKWLYAGTDRGNIHVVNIENFHLSGYVINWNKAIELSRKTHPGAVVHLSDNPIDTSKLLVGFETGQVVLWDLRSKQAEMRCQTAEALRSIAWHHEGKQFMCSHVDGTLTTWSVRLPIKPLHVSQPHAKPARDDRCERYKPITKVDWKSSKTGEAYVIFAGGMPAEQASRTPSITVVHSKTTTVLEMEHPVLDFITLCESPYTSDLQDPFCIIALLQNDLVVMDLQSVGFPCLENPYPMDIHESAVTCCSYLADCPMDLIPAFYSVGRTTGAGAGGGGGGGSGGRKVGAGGGLGGQQQMPQGMNQAQMQQQYVQPMPIQQQISQSQLGYSSREWPISGGTWSANSCSYSEIILTGHADGSIKFWDASAGTLQVLYKLKTSKVFDRNRRHRSTETGGSEEDPFAIQLIALCAESRKLCVAGASAHVILFTFRKAETCDDVTVLEVPIVYEIPDEGEVSPDCQFTGAGSAGSSSRLDMSDNDNKKELLRVRTGVQKKPPGFQAQLVCLTPWNHGEPPSHITSLTINSNYGLMAYGNEAGIVIIDIEQKVCLLNVGSPDLYGAQDPYVRAPRSPKRAVGPPVPGQGNNGGGGGDGLGIGGDDRQPRSPSIDQLLGRSPPSLVGAASSSGPASPTLPPLHTASPIEPAMEAVEDDSIRSVPIPKAPTQTAAATRRKSSTWKVFQRQLSKVDLKLKSTFNNTEQKSNNGGCGKRHSIFYSEIEPQSSDNIEENERSSPEDNSDEQTTIVRRLAEEGIVERRDSEELTSPEIAEGLPEDDVDLLVGSLGTHYEIHQPIKKVGFKTMSDRTHNLEVTSPNSDITNDSNAPVRPPRSKQQQNATKQQQIASLKLNLNQTQTNKLQFHLESTHFHKTLDVTSQSTVKRDGRRLQSVPNIKLPKAELQHLRDLRKKEAMNDMAPFNNLNPPAKEGSGFGQGRDNSTGLAGHIKRRFNKLDNSFSRSRSSSMSSLETIASEAIQCLAFADSYARRNDTTLIPTLWVGTSLGSVLTILVTPPDADSRSSQPVVVSLVGVTIFRLKGSIMSLSFLDCTGALIPYTFESWRDDSKERQRTPTKSSASRMSPTTMSAGLENSRDINIDRQYVVIASEKQARVVALPSQTCIYRQQLADVDFVVKAEAITFKDSVCLMCYISNGHLAAYSLPSLRPLIDIDFLPLTELSFQTQSKNKGIVDPMLSIWGQQLIINEDTDQISRTFCFSNKGHGLYLTSPSELQKYTLCIDFCSTLPEMFGELFLPLEMPEPPKEGFFKGLFGGGVRTLDREELFGEASGKASKNLAKHIPGPGMTDLNQRVMSSTSEINRAHKLMLERGEKLGQLDDRAERMSSEAEAFRSTAHDLMLKYKDKKWYQL